LSSGKKYGNVMALNGKKLNRGNSKRNHIIDDDFGDENIGMSQKTNRTNLENNDIQYSKDNPYTIFHALGKFLYNKSIYLFLVISISREKPTE